MNRSYRSDFSICTTEEYFMDIFEDKSIEDLKNIESSESFYFAEGHNANKILRDLLNIKSYGIIEDTYYRIQEKLGLSEPNIEEAIEAYDPFSYSHLYSESPLEQHINARLLVENTVHNILVSDVRYIIKTLEEAMDSFRENYEKSYEHEINEFGDTVLIKADGLDDEALSQALMKAEIYGLFANRAVSLFSNSEKFGETLADYVRADEFDKGYSIKDLVESDIDRKKLTKKPLYKPDCIEEQESKEQNSVRKARR